LTWIINSISGNGGESVKTFKARPDCGAASGEVMRAEVSPGGATAQSAGVTIKFPLLELSKTPLVQVLHVGDTASWTITVKTPGPVISSMVPMSGSG
jgi:hypothetical protein